MGSWDAMVGWGVLDGFLGHHGGVRGTRWVPGDHGGVGGTRWVPGAPWWGPYTEGPVQPQVKVKRSSGHPESRDSALPVSCQAPSTEGAGRPGPRRAARGIFGWGLSYPAEPRSGAGLSGRPELSQKDSPNTPPGNSGEAPEKRTEAPPSLVSASAKQGPTGLT